MRLHFIEAPKDGKLRKQIGNANGIDTSYPQVKYLSSYEYEVEKSKDGLGKYRKLLQEQGLQGRALMKGLFPHELQCESRAGLIKNEGTTSLLILDIDGLDLDLNELSKGKTVKHMTKRDVENVAESVISMLPEELHNVSYVAVASSSFGISAKQVSIHIHMFLEDPIDVKELTVWLRSLNFSQADILPKLKLTKQKYKVKSVIDPCLAQQNRIVYICPAFFGPRVPNPFKNDTQRYVLVTKEKSVVDLRKLLKEMDENSELLAKVEKDTLNTLQKKYGVPTAIRKTTRIHSNGRDYHVVSDPFPTQLRYHSDTDRLVAYNRPGDTSGPYFVLKENPEIIWSLKPDDRPELFKNVDYEAYQNHVATYGSGFSKEETHGVVRKVRRHMFIDQMSDKYHVMTHDYENDVVLELVPKSKETAEQFMQFKGQIVPEPVPTWYIEFDPTRKESLFQSQDKTVVNQFIPSSYMLATDKHELDGLVTYGQASHLQFYCPTIYQIIYHMLGNADEEYEHFMNWFCAIFQKRMKTKTGWLTHGTQGTGKGLFFNKIVSKLIHSHHTRQVKLQQLVDDQFNGWMEYCLFIMVDEFNLANAGKNTSAAANDIKTMVTEPTFSMRKMQREQVARPQYMNFFLATNDVGALSMEDKRRFNVAPRQQIMLEDRFPEIHDEEKFDALIDSEMEEFAAFLRGFKVSVPKVRQILANKAKLDASEAGMNAADKFFKIIRYGDFESLSELLDITDAMLGQDTNRMVELMHIKRLLRIILSKVNTDMETYLLVDDLRRIYQFLAEKVISKNAFGQMLAKQEIPQVRKSEPLGVAKRMPSRPRCVPITWQMSDETTLRDLERNNQATETNNSDAPPADVIRDTM